MISEKTCRTCKKCGAHEGPDKKFKKDRALCYVCASKDAKAQKAKIDPTKIKICNACGHEGPSIEFVPQLRRCKKCQSARNKEYLEENKEIINARHRRNYAADKAADPEKINKEQREWNRENSEKVNAWSAEYRRKNPEKVKVIKRNWYERHTEHVAHKSKTWRQNNPLQHRALNANREALKKARPGTFTESDIETLYNQQEGICIYCRKSLTSSFHVDHIIPLVNNDSTNWPSNLQLLCPSCNCGKGAKSHEEYLEYRRIVGLPVFDNREAA